MPKTPPTIVAPLPNDPRVMSLAKTLSRSKREAYAAACESWAWMSVMAVDDIVVKAAPDSLDAVVDIDGFGQAMFQAGLVGVVDEGLVLPAELRHRQQQGERGGGATADDERSPDVRRKAQNAEAARRYRKRSRATGSKAKSANKSYKTLGFVAGHEVRAFDGQFGPYAMVLGATLGGQAFRKLTAGAKDKPLESVTLADVLPGMVEKWKGIHERERKIHDPAKRKALVPSFEEFRSAAERHHDGDDASCRHHDASCLPSSSNRQGDDANPNKGRELDAAVASSSRHDDALSSMSSSSSSLSFSKKKREEEEEGIKSRRIRLPRQQRAIFDNRTGYAAQKAWSVETAAAELGVTDAEVREMGAAESWCRFRRKLLDTLEATAKADAWAQRLQQVGVNPADNASEAPGEPVEARDDIGTTADTTADDKPAEGNVGARGEDADRPAHDPHETFVALTRQGIPLPAVKDAPGRGRRLDDDDAFERGADAARLLPVG
jgi:hypothetical protein